MQIVGLTGGIASGKSLVAAFLQQHHAVPIIDADAIAHALCQPGQAGLQRIVDDFGKRWLTSDGALDRAAFADYIFSQPAARQQLNNILHPMIRQQVDLQIQRYRQQSVPRVVVMAALLLEVGWAFSPLLIVLAPPELQIERLQKQRGLSLQQAQARLQAQWSNQQRQAVPDAFILWNQSTQAELHNSAAKLWPKIISAK